MEQATATPTKPLIESDRVEGTTIYGANGERIGTVKRLMIEKVSGRVANAVVAFGGFSDLGADAHTIPWGKLTYEPALAATGRMSPKPNSGRHPASRPAKSTTGRIATARSNCTIIIGSRHTGEPSSPGSRAGLRSGTPS